MVSLGANRGAGAGLAGCNLADADAFERHERSARVGDDPDVQHRPGAAGRRSGRALSCAVSRKGEEALFDVGARRAVDVAAPREL